MKPGGLYCFEKLLREGFFFAAFNQEPGSQDEEVLTGQSSRTPLLFAR
jgi:hypothetical protein